MSFLAAKTCACILKHKPRHFATLKAFNACALIEITLVLHAINNNADMKSPRRRCRMIYAGNKVATEKLIAINAAVWISKQDAVKVAYDYIATLELRAERYYLPHISI
jgi:hypothetical protein